MKRLFAIFTVLIIGVFGLLAFTACDDEQTPMDPPEVPVFVNITAEKIQPVEYTGSAITPAVVVRNGDTALAEGTDYTVSYSDNVQIGQASATITFIGEYEGTAEIVKRFDITAIAPDKLTVDAIAPREYDGTAYTPEVVIKHGEKTLAKDTDYTLTYTNNVNAGTGTVTAEMKGVYGGYVVGSFTITKKVITPNRIAIERADGETLYQTLGEDVRPAITVKQDGNPLVEGEHYTLAYSDNKYLDKAQGKGVGKATVSFISDGNYDYSAITDNVLSFDFFAPIDKPFYAETDVLSDSFYKGNELSWQDGDGLRSMSYKAVLLNETDGDNGLYVAAVVKHNMLPGIGVGVMNSSRFDVRLVNAAGTLNSQHFIYYDVNKGFDVHKYNPDGSYNPDAYSDPYIVMKLHEIGDGTTSARYATVMQAYYSADVLEEIGFTADEVKSLLRIRVIYETVTSGEVNSANSKTWYPAKYTFGSAAIGTENYYLDYVGGSQKSAHVGVNGIVDQFSNATVVDLGEGIVIDNDDSDWAGYGGHVGIDKGVDANAGASFTYKAKTGKMGMYFYSESKLPFVYNDKGAIESSGLCHEIFVKKGTDAVKRIGFYYFKKGGLWSDGKQVGPLYYNVSETDSQVAGANDRYRTVTEGFISYNALNVSARATDGIGEDIFDLTTGELKAGYVLHFGAYCRINPLNSVPDADKVAVKTTTYLNGTINCISEPGIVVDSLSGFDRMYSFDADGEMTCFKAGGNKNAAITVDGSLNDWGTAFGTNLENYKWKRTFTNKNDTSIKHDYTQYGYLGENGLYAALVVTNVSAFDNTNGPWSATNVEINFANVDFSDGAPDDNNNTAKKVVYLSYTGDGTNASFKWNTRNFAATEFAKGTFSATYANKTLIIEYFIPTSAIEAVYSQSDIVLLANIFYLSNDYHVTPSPHDQWWIGSHWNTIGTADNQEYRFVTANGLHQ